MTFLENIYVKVVGWLTQSLKKLRSGKLSIEEQRVIMGVIGPTHPDQKNIHATCRHTDALMKNVIELFVAAKII